MSISMVNHHNLQSFSEDLLANAFFNQSPNILGIKDRDSRYIYTNTSMAHLLGYSSKEDLLEQSPTDADTHCAVAQYADFFREEDLHTLLTGESQEFLAYQCYANHQWSLVYGKKFPIKNITDEIMGVGLDYCDVTHNPFINLARLMEMEQVPGKNTKAFSYKIDACPADLNLSHRQMECLFYFIRGKSASDIATLLTLSKRTIETHLEQIKDKLNCSSKAMLIEKVIHAGGLNVIPRTLLHLK